jgi:hypothetical protein
MRPLDVAISYRKTLESLDELSLDLVQAADAARALGDSTTAEQIEVGLPHLAAFRTVLATALDRLLTPPRGTLPPPPSYPAQ